MGLQLDRPLLRHRHGPVVVVFHPGVVDDLLVVERHRHLVAAHHDPEAVPLAERLVGLDERILAGSAGGIVPQAARALREAEVLRVGEARIPDLHLGNAAEIDPRIGLRYGPVIDEEFEVAVVLLGGGIRPEAIVDQFAVLDVPVGLLGRIADFKHRVLLIGSGPLADLLLPLVGRHRQKLAVVEGLAAAPAGEILAVEQRRESGRRLIGADRATRHKHRRRHDHAPQEPENTPTHGHPLRHLKDPRGPGPVPEAPQSGDSATAGGSTEGRPP